MSSSRSLPPQNDTSSPDSDGTSKSNAAPSQKRRPSRAGTRSVATLSAAQLERKRANDREAQRAIRQRTKEHIEKLETKIRDLEAPGQPTSEQLGAALRRNKELEDEVAYLRVELHKLQVSLGMGESGGAFGSRQSAVQAWDGGAPTSRAPLPSSSLQSSMQIMSQSQLPPAVAPSGESSRPDQYTPYRQGSQSQWQPSASYTSGPRSKREITPSTMSDHSPENNPAWPAERSRMSDHHSATHPTEYSHIGVPPPQPMPIRGGSHVIPYQTPPQDPQGYQMTPHGSQQQVPSNAPINQYGTVHGSHTPYLSHHPQQHPQQPSQQTHSQHQQPPPRSPSGGPRQEQQMFYGGFPQG